MLFGSVHCTGITSTCHVGERGAIKLSTDPMRETRRIPLPPIKSSRRGNETRGEESHRGLDKRDSSRILSASNLHPRVDSPATALMQERARGKCGRSPKGRKWDEKFFPSAHTASSISVLHHWAAKRRQPWPHPGQPVWWSIAQTDDVSGADDDVQSHFASHLSRAF